MPSNEPFHYPDDEMSEERLTQIITNIPVGKAAVITRPDGETFVVLKHEDGNVSVGQLCELDEP